MNAQYLVLPLVLLAAACDSTADDPPDGGGTTAVDATFTVSQIDAKYVPIVEGYDLEPFPGCEKVQSGGHLVLFADGRYTLRVREEAILCDGTPKSWGAFGGTGRYVRAGDKITLSFDGGRPDMTGSYDPSGGGGVSGTNFPGPTPIPAITLVVDGESYLLVQEINELANR